MVRTFAQFITIALAIVLGMAEDGSNGWGMKTSGIESIPKTMTAASTSEQALFGSSHAENCIFGSTSSMFRVPKEESFNPTKGGADENDSSSQIAGQLAFVNKKMTVDL